MEKSAGSILGPVFSITSTCSGLAKVYYVLKGTGRFSLAGREEILREGEALVAPAGVEHGLSNRGPDPLLILVLVAPPPKH